MFEVFGVRLHWYGLLIGIGVLAAMKIADRIGKGLDKKKMESAMWWTVAGGVFGARIYHVIDYWSRYYSHNPEKIFNLWEGGLGIWGALIGGVATLCLYCYFNKLNFLKYLDVFVVGVPLAQAIGRVGNYVNRELYGKNNEPLFAYEGVLNLILFGLLLFFSKRKKSAGFVSAIYLIGYGIIRVALENLRPDASIWKIGGVPTATAIGAISILTGIFLIFRGKQS